MSLLQNEKQIVANEQHAGFCRLRSSLESLPNELLFMIIAHLSSPDLVQAFYGLNHRFDLMIYQSARYFTISENTLETRFAEYKSQIKNTIEILCFDVQLLPQIFLSPYSYSNLRSIVLRCSDLITVDLNVDCDSAKCTVHSCLDVLRVSNILPVGWDNDDWFNDNEHRSAIEKDVQEEAKLSRLICPAIVRLSICDCSEQALRSVCLLAPNLTYLKVSQLDCTDDNSNFNLISTLIPQPSRLKQLHITSTTNRLNHIHAIEKLIDYYRSSLEHLTLEISLNNPVNGYDLQRTLERCQYLKKLAFTFNCWHEETEEIDVVCQFQSDWWLDCRRPPVLIFCSNHCETLIVSMPCCVDGYLWFPIDPKDWLVNKGLLDSPNVYFTKQKSIRFANRNHQPITLEAVHIIGHVFRASKQELSIPHWRFILPDFLLEQLISTRSQPPVLPMVYSLDLNSCNLDQLDAKTLIIWLLLAANIRVLNMCQGTPSAKIQLANRLKALLEEDNRLRFVTDSIEEVHVFYMFDSLNYATKQHICQMYSNIFRKPLIRR